MSGSDGDAKIDRPVDAAMVARGEPLLPKKGGVEGLGCLLRGLEDGVERLPWMLADSDVELAAARRMSMQLDRQAREAVVCKAPGPD